IPLKRKISKIKVVTCAPLFADVMTKVQDNTSISDQFLM
ncbi:MAG: ribose-phosphate pyrophosphokinase, partial [Flavobacterium sp.]|nr:ribose-phosphate pyrophosphokinase [Flavobacterium sp.]